MSTQSISNKPPLVKQNVIFFIAINILGLIIAPVWGLVYGFTTTAWILCAAILTLSGLSITAGYHRLWSHRTYKASKPLKWVLAFFGIFSLQNSILIWAARHRVHHRHVDDVDQDPHSIKTSFWHAHIGWMIRDWPSSKIDFDQVKDLQNDEVVMWQHRVYWPMVWTLNLGVPAAVGFMVGDVIGTILLAGAFRLAFSQHCTFFINSLAHTWGKRNYSDENTARDNGVIALLTWGEGYHNFHHAFQADYRNGLRWWQFDPGKWLIATAAAMGMARELRRTPKFKIQRARLQMQFRELRARLAAADDSASNWRETVDREYHQFKETVAQWQAVQADRVAAGKEALRDRWRKTELRTRYKELEYRLKMQARRLATLQEACAAV